MSTEKIIQVALDFCPTEEIKNKLQADIEWYQSHKMSETSLVSILCDKIKRLILWKTL